MVQPWCNKLAIVSGASSGLGLHLALALAQQGSRLVLIGRDRARLEGARNAALLAGSPDVRAVSMDISREDAWSQENDDVAVLRSALDDENVDLLINVVGRSDRGRLKDLTATDLAAQFQVNVLSTFQTTRACLPSLQRAGGTVVDIASLAGIIAGPCMGGYCMAKHALVGMHRQWRLEMAATDVHFLLVFPGPIQGDDNHDRYAELAAARGIDANAARAGGGVRLNRLDPKSLSRQILSAAANRRTELIVPSKARWLAALMPLWPDWADRIIRKRFS